MLSRFSLLSSVCIFAVLASVQVLAQSNRASVAGHRARVSKATAGLSGAPPVSVTFAAAVASFSGGNGANAVAVADVNGDGKPDIVISNWCSDNNCTGGSVGVLLGNGDGTFQPATSYLSGGLYADSIAVADLNGDGNPDLVVANCGANANANCAGASGNVAVLLGNGDGTFQTAVPYHLGGGGFGSTSVAVADVNGDSKLDLVVAGGCNGGGCVGVLLGNGDGTFQSELTPSGSGGISALWLAVADLNGDGHSDVVVANQCADNTCTSSSVGVLLGKGDGTFQTVVAYDPGGLYSDGVEIADVNGDGKPDLVVVNSSTSLAVDDGNVGVLLGNGDGTFQTAVPYPSGAFGAASVAVADINGDSKLDLLVANCSGSKSDCSGGGGSIGVLLGNGDGTFQTAVTYGSGSNTPFGVAVEDVNGDGKPDIIAANCFSDTCGGANGAVGVLLQVAPPVASTTTLNPISPSTVAFGTSVTLTANVSAKAGAPPNPPIPPDGETVTFKDVNTNKPLGTGTLSKGTAIFISKAIPAGTYSVVASYPGGGSFLPSISAPRALNEQDFKLTASPTTVPISAPGQDGSTTITITTYGNLAASSLTNWTCSGLPSESQCTFGTVNSKDQVSLSITTTAASDLRWPVFGHQQGLFYAILLPGLLGVVSMRGRRRVLRGLRPLALIVVLGLPALWLACGGGSSSTKPSNPGTPAGNSTVTIHATSGSLQRSIPITVTVQ